MEGFRLAARFSIATNRLNYCGPADAAPVLYRAIVDGSDRAATEEALAQFEALYPYLEAIARKHGRHPFDPEVVEAYWIGNALLDDFGREDFPPLLRALVARGLPGFVARELERDLPAHPIPHHLFHVLFVGVGSVTGHVTTNLSNAELCRPGWGKVREIGPNQLEVQQSTLVAAEGGVALGEDRRATIAYDRRMLPDLAVGDTIAVHWGWGALRLERSQAEALERYTRRSIAAAHRRGVLDSRLADPEAGRGTTAG